MANTSDPSILTTQPAPRSLVGAHLIFTHTQSNLDHFTIDCDALSISYRFSSTPDADDRPSLEDTRRDNDWKAKLVHVTRWDPTQQRNIPIAEWERRPLGFEGRIKLLLDRNISPDPTQEDDGFVPTKEFFVKTFGRGSYFYGGICNRMFEGPDGHYYTWKTRVNSMKLFRDDNRREPIAKFISSWKFFNSHPSRIIILRECWHILDLLVLTCVIAEYKRRRAQRIDHRP